MIPSADHLTVQQAAQRLGLKPQQLYHLIRSGQLPSERDPVFGRRVLRVTDLASIHVRPRGRTAKLLQSQ